jgi:uncharacterized protein YfaS (alpha-2-macroglobulin family)
MEFLALSDAGVSEPAEMDRRARELVDYVVANGHGNTQETAMVVTALAQYTQRLAANVGQAAATIVRGDAKTEVRGSDAWRDTAKGPGLSWLVTNTGSAPIFVSWTMSGIPTQIEPGPVAEGGLTVTRRLLKASGEEVSGADIVFAPGEACVVDLKINCSKPMESVVLVDMLPAGFEVDNPRLQPDAVPQAKLDEATAPSWLDLRDDRLIIAWDDLKAGDNSYHYVARAVFKGIFAQPQTAAECMYDAAVRSATVAEKVEVK